MPTNDNSTQNTKLNRILKKNILTRNDKRTLSEFLSSSDLTEDLTSEILSRMPPLKKRRITKKKEQKIYCNNIIMSTNTKEKNTEKNTGNDSSDDDNSEIINLDENDSIITNDSILVEENVIMEEDIIIEENYSDNDSKFENCYIVSSSSDDDDEDILIIDEADNIKDIKAKNVLQKTDINRKLLEGILRTKLRSSIKKALAENTHWNKHLNDDDEDDEDFDINEESEIYKNLSFEQKEKVKSIEIQIKEINDKSVPEKVKILLSDIPLETKAIIIKKLELLQTLENSGSEYKKLREWLDNILKIPFGKYCKFSLSKQNDYTEIGNKLYDIKGSLDKAIYGQEQVKEALVELVAKWVSNPPSKGHALAIVGPPGCGKTTLFREGLAKALERPFASFSLSGMSDESYLSGFAHTYEGSDYGRICRMLTETDCMNPIIFMDELDKIDTTRHGSSVVHKIMEIIDFSQNHEYEDMYFGNIKIDLSRVLFVFSLNHIDMIDPILRDRLEVIKVKGFQLKEKVKILKDYIIPKELKEIGLDENDIIFPEKIISFIIRKIRKEEGIREGKRAIQIIIRKINLLQYVHDIEKGDKTFSYHSKNIKLPITITEKLVNKLLIEEERPAFLNLYT
jgi:ATP-dependent Lon protease